MPEIDSIFINLMIFLRKRWLRIILLSGLVITITGVLLWRLYFSEASDSMEQALQFISFAEKSRWTFPFVVLTYILAGLVFFPVTALIVVTGYIFDPIEGLFYTLTGVLASTAIGYSIGAYLGAERISKMNRAIFARLGKSSANHGILWIVIVRNIPIAPFSLVNMYFGCSRFTLLQLLIGTFLGMGPGIAILVYLSANLHEIAEGGHIRMAIPIMTLLIIALGIGSRKLFKKMMGLSEQKKKV